MKAFLTGSHAYGTPHEDSDVDLVVRCDHATMITLVALFAPTRLEEQERKKESGDGDTHQFRIGKLNLIICTTDARFEAWKKGTATLQVIAPVTREQACKMFAKLFETAKEKP